MWKLSYYSNSVLLCMLGHCRYRLVGYLCALNRVVINLIYTYVVYSSEWHGALFTTLLSSKKSKKKYIYIRHIETHFLQYLLLLKFYFIYVYSRQFFCTIQFVTIGRFCTIK